MQCYVHALLHFVLRAPRLLWRGCLFINARTCLYRFISNPDNVKELTICFAAFVCQPPFVFALPLELCQTSVRAVPVDRNCDRSKGGEGRSRANGLEPTLPVCGEHGTRW